MDVATIRTEYARLEHSYELLKDEVVFSIEEALRKNEIVFHLVEGRVKTIDSLITKIEQNEIEEPFEEIQDICGVRIIALFNSDLKACGTVVEELFDIKDIDKKATNQPDSQFDYMSDHYIATIPPEYSGPRYNRIKGIQFEIQIRTIATHAWATISHYLDYKSQKAIPSDLRRDFYALNALFYLADSNFERFFQASQETQELAIEKAQVEGGIAEEEINFDTLSAYLKQTFLDRKPSDPSSVSELIDELIEAGYETISELDYDVKRTREAFGRYERENRPMPGPRYSTVGVVRSSLSISSEQYFKVRKGSDESLQVFDKYRQYILPTPTVNP